MVEHNEKHYNDDKKKIRKTLFKIDSNRPPFVKNLKISQKNSFKRQLFISTGIHQWRRCVLVYQNKYWLPKLGLSEVTSI